MNSETLEKAQAIDVKIRILERISEKPFYAHEGTDAIKEMIPDWDAVLEEAAKIVSGRIDIKISEFREQFNAL